ncbi:MAG: hypothetical protein M1820_000213 [Bogoriella megaspora]|nr:MAG: hypothetical protein M1820_000213 [Bogoriella megaspora]
MTEDEIYRASSQYRLWSFTPEALASLRANTNSAAAARVRAAIRRGSKLNSTTNGASNGETNGAAKTNGKTDRDTECLTVEEEAKLVQYYCSACLQMADSFDFLVPINVKATAVQYIKRFYLYNSPMTYHPKQIMPSALFLATKTENHYISVSKYVKGIRKATPEDILAPEFIITQALRFTFDVRHPHRALKGGIMELLSLAAGTSSLLPGLNKSPSQLASELRSLPAENGIPQNPTERINRAYEAAKHLLSNAAILTDAYFLYTPSQIFLSSLYSADKLLTFFYLSTKFPSSTFSFQPSPSFTSTPPVLSKLLLVLEACTQLLHSHRSTKEERDECVRIDKKLYQCRNPEKMDLVGLNRAQKRGGGVEGEVTESVGKKRRLEREVEAKRSEEVFGGELKREGG